MWSTNLIDLIKYLDTLYRDLCYAVDIVYQKCFMSGDITDKGTNQCDEMSFVMPIPGNPCSKVDRWEHDLIKTESFMESDRIAKSSELRSETNPTAASDEIWNQTLLITHNLNCFHLLNMWFTGSKSIYTSGISPNWKWSLTAVSTALFKICTSCAEVENWKEPIYLPQNPVNENCPHYDNDGEDFRQINFLSSL